MPKFLGPFFGAFLKFPRFFSSNFAKNIKFKLWKCTISVWKKFSCWLVFILLWCFHYMQELLWFHNCPSHLDSSKSSYISFILQFSELAGVMNVWAWTSELIYSWESKLTHALLCFWYWTFLDCFWFNLVFSALVILASKSSLLSKVQYIFEIPMVSASWL